MKAIIYEKYGPPKVLKMVDLPKPTPKPNEVLIRIKATAVNSADWRLRKPEPFAVRLFFGLFKPKRKILGGVFSGEIEAVGTETKKFKAGDEIFGSLGMKMGAYAQFAATPENGPITIKPKNVSHAEAATIPFGGFTANHFLKKAMIAKGDTILIVGASGAVGTAAIQLAKQFGAEVTAVCGSSNIELVKTLGADYVIDYNKEDFSVSNKKYDVVFETVGKTSATKCFNAVKPKGRLILGSANFGDIVTTPIRGMIKNVKVITGVASEKTEDLEFLMDLVEQGKFKPVIDKTFTLNELQQAHAYVEKGHKKGNVAVEV